MLRHKNIDRLCCLMLALTVLLSGLYIGAAATGLVTADTAMGYETRLFDQSCVHTIDIVMDDWEGFLDTCTSEEYSACHLVIDGEHYKNVAIRGKGNTSLSSVAAYGNNRYSFKVEFDHYQTGHTYYGLDKLSLNNIIQDNTYMKDYFAYTMMNRMGVAAPLCSFVRININGEYWGLYLAVEGVEDGFLQRNYGRKHGELYKPDSMSFGGGRGNGRDFNMGDFDFSSAEGEHSKSPFSLPEMPGNGESPALPEGFTPPGKEFGGFGGFGSSTDVKLQYTDDDPSSYANIFNNAKTDVSRADQARLIASLKALNEGDTSAVDTDAVLRYMAVHHFLCNEDSYTGMMVHNYYLYEEDGVLSMIPWDYNLAYGTMSGGNATSTVNTSIDTLVSKGSSNDRPMVSWITSSQESLEAYHAVYGEFMAEVFESGWFAEEIDRVTAMISPYVQSDPTAFCTYEEFLVGAETLKGFCLKRAESICSQLKGDDTPVDASEIDLSAMGTMNNGGGMGNRGERGEHRREAVSNETPAMPEMPEMPETPPDGFAGSAGDAMPQLPPDGFDSFGGQANAPAEKSSAAPADASAALNSPQQAEPKEETDRSSAMPDASAAMKDRLHQNNGEAWSWILGCTVLLAAALIFAKCYQTHR